MSAPEIKARYSSLGQIRVEIYRFEATACEPRKPSSRYYEAKETSVIPEKALKGQALNLTTRFVAPGILWGILTFRQPW
jgi:hypothetical protein